jgi:hypothetical protein
MPLKPPSTSLNFLADDGVIKATFAGILKPDHYVELTEATAETTTVQPLQRALLAVGEKWQITTVTQILSQKRWPAS